MVMLGVATFWEYAPSVALVEFGIIHCITSVLNFRLVFVNFIIVEIVTCKFQINAI